MPRPKPDKSEMLNQLAQYVLEHGLNDASLRPMAAASGTSDRMLLYHFKTKDALIAELLNHIAQIMSAGLDQVLPPERFPNEDTLIQRLVTIMRTPQFQPFTRLWFDMLSSASGGQVAHRETGHAILEHFLEWMSLRHPDCGAGAARALTLVEGVLIMDAMGQSAIANRAIGLDQTEQ